MSNPEPLDPNCDRLIAEHQQVLKEPDSIGRDADVTDSMACLRILEKARRSGSSIAWFETDSTVPPKDSICRDDQANEKSLGHFRLHRCLGEGSFGIVYAATDTRLDRTVALKIARPEVSLSPSMTRRFRREAEMAARLEHPGIVPVFEYGEIEGIHFIAHAYCEAITLADWIADHPGPVPSHDAAVLMNHLADAIAHAHQSGVLHRDIKPSNILLVREGETDSLSAMTPRITDFGLGRLTGGSGGKDDDIHGARQTKTGAVLGTPSFMSPEQAGGASDKVFTSTDVYALGVILYQLICGRLPFEQTDTVSLLRSVASDPPPSPRKLRPSIPRDLEAICLKCLEKDPRRRYASGSELAEEVQNYLSHRSVSARSLTPWVRSVRWIRRNPAWAALTFSVLFSISAIAIGASVAASRLARQKQSIEKNLQRALRAEEEQRRTVAVLRNELFVRSQDARIASLTRVIDQNPDALDSIYQRGTEYWRRLDYDRAIEDFRRALELNPQHPNAAADLAWIYMLGGPDHRDDRVAMELLRPLVRRDTDNWSILATATLAYCRAANWDAADEAIRATFAARRVDGYEPNSLHWYLDSWIASQRGDLQRAQSSFRAGRAAREATSYELPTSEVQQIEQTVRAALLQLADASPVDGPRHDTNELSRTPLAVTKNPSVSDAGQGGGAKNAVPEPMDAATANR